MSPRFTGPGIYIDEGPAGIRAIAGVATSITAFIGRAERGPVAVATPVSGVADYERQFGGLCTISTMGFAVRDFFANGGREAIIIRLFASAAPQVAQLAADTLSLVAANPGAWGNALRCIIDTDGARPDAFNLTIHDAARSVTEHLVNLSVDPASPDRIDLRLAHESNLLRLDGGLPAASPAAHPAAGAGEDRWGDNAIPNNSRVLAQVNDGDRLDAAACGGMHNRLI
jgi:uncharacterized protein